LSRQYEHNLRWDLLAFGRIRDSRLLVGAEPESIATNRL
jgi:hypothetical protein